MKYPVFEKFPGSFEKVNTGMCLNLSEQGTFNLAEGDHPAAASKVDFSPLFPLRTVHNKTWFLCRLARQGLLSCEGGGARHVESNEKAGRHSAIGY